MVTKSNYKQKREIKRLVKELLKKSHDDMISNIDKVLNSGCIDIDHYNQNHGPYVLPKIITTALLQQESTSWDGTGTGLEKIVKKEVKNIRYFI